MQPEANSLLIETLLEEISGLKQMVSDLQQSVDTITSPAAHLNNSDKASLILDAHRSGDPARIRNVTRLVNGERL